MPEREIINALTTFKNDYNSLSQERLKIGILTDDLTEEDVDKFYEDEKIITHEIDCIITGLNARRALRLESSNNEEHR